MLMIHWFGAAKDTEKRGLPSINLGTAILVAIMMLSVIGLSPAHIANDEASQADTSAATRMNNDCAVIQQLTYEPCGHTMTRREALPEALRGKTRTELEQYYEGWRVVSFAAGEVQMAQTLAMHCPQHVVLKADDSGLLCVWQNTYGDALSLVRELGTPLSDFADEVQEQLRFGIGFDTDDALTQWLESAES